MSSTDTELVARIQAGDVDAFAALVERHRRVVVHLVRRFVRNADGAEDLAQETFVSAFQNIRALRDGGKFGAWLQSIAVNVARQWRRREAQMSLETLCDESDATPVRGSLDAATEHVRDVVRDALAALPPEQLSAVLLHYFDGYNYGETAALLHVPASTVRGRLHEARRKLREEMRELAQPKAKGKDRKAMGWECALTSEDLKALRRAAMLASHDPERTVLNTICIEPDGTLVSTDAHRLFLYRGSAIKPPSRVLVRSSLFTHLKYRSELSEAQLTIVANEATLRFTDERDTPPEHVDCAPLTTDERFPCYEKVISAEWRITASLSVRDLLAALDEVARFEAFLASVVLPDSEHVAHKIALTFSEGNGSVMIQDDAIKTEPAPARWAVSTEIPVTLDGLKAAEGFTVAVNGRYLRECMGALAIAASQRVEMRFNSPHSPILVKPEDANSCFILMMPMLR